MKRIVLALMMTLGVILALPASASACEMTSQCASGDHASCPFALESTEDFDCSCPCHDALFELEAIELGL